MLLKLYLYLCMLWISVYTDIHIYVICAVYSSHTNWFLWTVWNSIIAYKHVLSFLLILDILITLTGVKPWYQSFKSLYRSLPCLHGFLSPALQGKELFLWNIHVIHSLPNSYQTGATYKTTRHVSCNSNSQSPKLDTSLWLRSIRHGNT